MSHPESVQLKHSVKIERDGKIESGPLVADEKGIAVDVSTSERHGMKKITTTHRYYLLGWPAVTGYEISRPAANIVVGSTTNGSDTILTITTTSAQHSWLLHFTSETQLRSKLGRYFAAIDQRS